MNVNIIEIVRRLEKQRAEDLKQDPEDIRIVAEAIKLFKQAENRAGREDDPFNKIAQAQTRMLDRLDQKLTHDHNDLADQKDLYETLHQLDI